MKALIMAAGFGKRLEPLTLAVPKPMVPVLNKPIMDHNIDLLKKNGVSDIIANIHYFPEQVENYFGSGFFHGISIKYSYEKNLMGTAGGVRRMGKDIGDIKDTFVVLSADALTDINLKRLLNFHRKKKSKATIALLPVVDTTQYGVVILDKDNRIVSFQEKPKPEKALSNLANIGTYVFEPEILDMIPKDKFFDFALNLFPILLKKKIPFYGYKMDEYWCDVGSIDQYRMANTDALTGKARTATVAKWKGHHWLEKNVHIHPTAQISGPVYLGSGCQIGAGVKIEGESVIGSDCRIRDNALIFRSILWSSTTVSEGAKIEDSIIGGWCQIGPQAEIEKGTVIGNRATIQKNTRIPAGSRIKPDQVI